MSYSEIMVAQAKSQVLRELGCSVEKEKVYLSGKLEYSSEAAFLGTHCLVSITKRYFTVGNSYTVKLDSGTYTGVAKLLEGAGYTYIGNVALMNSDFADMNTGESYCIVEIFIEGDAQEADAGQILVVDSNNGSNFSIEVITETIHPIDPKFIPTVDSLTINGTDGKQYKLTVSDGAISVTEVV